MCTFRRLETDPPATLPRPGAATATPVRGSCDPFAARRALYRPTLFVDGIGPTTKLLTEAALVLSGGVVEKPRAERLRAVEC